MYRPVSISTRSPSSWPNSWFTRKNSSQSISAMTITSPLASASPPSIAVRSASNCSPVGKPSVSFTAVRLRCSSYLPSSMCSATVIGRGASPCMFS